MKLVVFSICLNEESSVGELLDRVPERIEGITEIVKLVIDDGSSDNTAGVARNHGAHVVSNGGQKRLAYSFQLAVNTALELGADVAVNIDGDLQFKPEQIPLLVQPIVEGKADFVAADRFSSEDGNRALRPAHMPVGKYWANIIGSWIVGKLCGHSFSDVTCGFRAYNRKALLSLNINSRYTYTQESFQVLASKRLNIVAVPVDVIYYPGRKSRVVSSFFSFLFGSAVNIVRAFRDLTPMLFFGWLGLASFLLGVSCFFFITAHFLLHGTFTPYKFVGFGGLFFISLSLVVWIVGLVGDMLDRVLNNQEKILYLLKELKFQKK